MEDRPMYCTPLYTFAVGEERFTAEGWRRGRNYPYVVAVWRGYPRTEHLGQTMARPQRGERVGDAIVRSARDFVARKGNIQDAVSTVIREKV
jgi:hypothetical protein